jgi:uncharacterized membrane protein (UPF0127 family)
MNMRSMVICLLWLGQVMSASSAGASSVVFSRDVVVVQTIRNNTQITEQEEEDAVDVMKAKSSEATTEDKTRRSVDDNAPVITNHNFVVTIKNAEVTDPSWIIAQNNLRDDYGILYLYPEAVQAKIEKSDNKNAYDILFVDSYGTIHAIAKNIVPAFLIEPLESNRPTKALLYLNSGVATALDIQLQDTVKHTLFPKKPDMVSE